MKCGLPPQLRSLSTPGTLGRDEGEEWEKNPPHTPVGGLAWDAPGDGEHSEEENLTGVTL